MKEAYRKLIVKIAGGILFAGIFALALWYINVKMTPAVVTEAGIQYVPGKVTKVKGESLAPDPNAEGRMTGSQEIEVLIKGGSHRDENITITNYLSTLHNIHVKTGTSIIIRITTEANGSYTASVYNYNRTTLLYVFCALFLLVLCLIGGRQGMKAMLGLVFTIVCVFFIMLPLVSAGFAPILSAVGIVVITSVFCFLILTGISVKTAAGILGTIFGVALAGGIAMGVGELAHMGGYNMQEAESMMLAAGGNQMQISQMLTAGILISSLGAVMDIAMSIASSVQELHQCNPALKASALFRSGMNIGRDMMGTMSNTLILAFVGSSLNLMILIYAYRIPFTQLINTDVIGIEILQGVSSSLGMILTIPLVAFISANLTRYFFDRKDKEKSK